MSSTVRNGHKGEIWRTRAELPLLFRRLDVAERIERADVLPADSRRGIIDFREFRTFGFRDFWLPYKSVDVVPQAHGWQFIGREQRVEKPLVTACVHLQYTPTILQIHAYYYDTHLTDSSPGQPG